MTSDEKALKLADEMGDFVAVYGPDALMVSMLVAIADQPKEFLDKWSDETTSTVTDALRRALTGLERVKFG